MKKILFLLLFTFLVFGCSSSKLLFSSEIPVEKETVYLLFDDSQSIASTGGILVGNVFVSTTESASFNTLDNRLLTKNILLEKGFKVTQIKENADLILYGGCESNGDLSEVTLMLIDSKTEVEYAITKGTYGCGMDLKGDIKGALKNALHSIPYRRK